MTSKGSKRRTGGEDDTTRPHKKARLYPNDLSASHFDVFGYSYSVERSEDMFALHDGIQLPARINGGHIRASVVHGMKYPNRSCAGLLLKLRPTGSHSGGPSLLECEVLHPKALGCQLPVQNDIVHVALTDAKVVYNDKPDQLSFKLRFETALIYIQNAGSGVEPRILKLVDAGNALTKAKNGSVDSEKVHPVHVAAQSHTSSHMSRPEDRTAISHDAGTRRVRKRETRHANNQQNASDSLNQSAHKAARRLVKQSLRATLATTMNVSVAPKASSLSQYVEESLPPPLSHDDIATKETIAEPIQNNDQEHAVEAQRSEEASVPQEEVKEMDQEYFLSDNGIKFFTIDALDRLQNKSNVNIIGIVERIGEAKATRNHEFMQMFYLSDHTRPEKFLKVCLFQKTKETLPGVRVGQILLLQNLYIDDYNSTRKAVGNAFVLRWISYDPQTRQVFFAGSEMRQRYQSLNQKTKDYFATLASWKAKWITDLQNDPNRVMIAPNKKHRLLSELDQSQDALFFDGTVEVLGFGHTNWGIEIFVTDYTRNEIFDDRHAVSWEPVRWKRTLVIEVWPQEKQAYESACVIKPGKFYRLKNFMFRSTKQGWVAKVSSKDNAEFRQLPNDFDDPDLRRLIGRKTAFIPDNVDDDTNVSGMGDVFSGNPDEEINLAPMTELLSGHKLICGSTIAYTNFKAIDNDTRCHVEYKIRGRIVDITPSRPQEMVHLFCSRCEKVVATNTGGLTGCSFCKSANSLELRVRLSLLVIDETDECLSVIVSGDEAKYLFGMTSADSSNNASLESVVEDMVTKLRNVVGKLWVDGPSFVSFYKEGGTLSATHTQESEGASPWIDLAIRSWHVKDPEASSIQQTCWVRKYSLFNCSFRL